MQKATNQLTCAQSILRYTYHRKIFSKGVRFDIFFEDDENIYNIKMQCAKEYALSLRVGYCNSQFDMKRLTKGNKY
ncbi:MULTISPECIES: hypothetical protein [Lentihominibacter]|uniref:Uncharacterized protein n=1 Tax=Lentihominibacter hominis TaxID=2763645 RepID=A0A926IAJ5_9FIRM|nr:hypothetical protein [Lentihominibacter hominis]MBC8569190.1 hypothetical protein [Lentihominibacter hominis]